MLLSDCSSSPSPLNNHLGGFTLPIVRYSLSHQVTMVGIVEVIGGLGFHLWTVLHFLGLEI